MRVVILGSCVTRDMLEVRPHGLEILSYIARTSWVSQTSAPYPDEVRIGENLSQWGEYLVRTDLGKTVVTQLEAMQPDAVLIDLIDERLDLLRVGDSWITESEFLAKTDAFRDIQATHTDRLTAATPARTAQFERAIRALAPRLIAHLPDTTFVLHRAWYTAAVSDPGQTFPAGAKRTVATMNRWLADLCAVLGRHFGRRLTSVEAPPALRIADSRHRWGLAHYHYVGAYYRHVLDQVEAVDHSHHTAATVGTVEPAGARESRPAWLLERLLRPLRGAAR